MFKSIGFKIFCTIFAVLLISFIAMQIIINLDFKNNASKMSKEHLDTVSNSVFQTMRMAMNFGDSNIIKEAIDGAKQLDGIHDVVIYPSNDIIELFELKNPNRSNDELILKQFKNPELLSLEVMQNEAKFQRLIRPLIADESCISCHANTQVGAVIGVMDIYSPLDAIESDIAATSRVHIVIFTLALILTLIIVLWSLKIVVGRPVMELLVRAKELASGNGNLNSRIPVKGHDEIALACGYINDFIAKTQNAVSQTLKSSQEVEKQSILLNSNAENLDQLSTKSHAKAGESFKLGNNVGNELIELTSLSNEANTMNEHSSKLLNSMLDSLDKVANKVSSAAENEKRLADKIANMINQASNIRKATQMMDEIADKTNLLSLNAGIEAARAGSYGRGFSIIAEDVRTLAQNSEEFLKSVAEITNELLKSIQEVADELKGNAKAINTLNEDTSLLVENANEVKEFTAQAKDLVQACGQKIILAQQNITNLLSCMKENVSASEQNGEISKILLSVAHELKGVCEGLEKQLEEFEV